MVSDVRLINDNGKWDDFVSKSPQGTIFCSSKWLEMYNEPYKIYGVYKGNNLVGGSAFFKDLQPITPFQGMLVESSVGKYVSVMSLHHEVATALLDILPDQFYNHYTFPDVRPFLWAGWGAKVKYTYVVHPQWEELDKDTRNVIKNTHVEVKRSEDIQFFDSLYGFTFARKGIERTASTKLIYKLWETFKPDLYIASDNSAGVLLIKDNKRSYYILGASEGTGTSAKVLWEAIWRLDEVDLVGANDHKISDFKRQFGGKLCPYYGVVRLSG
jgi:hypothetical protein